MTGEAPRSASPVGSPLDPRFGPDEFGSAHNSAALHEDASCRLREGP